MDSYETVSFLQRSLSHYESVRMPPRVHVGNHHHPYHTVKYRRPSPYYDDDELDEIELGGSATIAHRPQLPNRATMTVAATRPTILPRSSGRSFYTFALYVLCCSHPAARRLVRPLCVRAVRASAAAAGAQRPVAQAVLVHVRRLIVIKRCDPHLIPAGLLHWPFRTILELFMP